MLIGHSLADANGIVLAIDETITDLLHRPQASVIGHSYLGMTHPADRAHNARQVTDLRSGTGPVSIRKRYIRSDGESVWARVQVSRLGGPSGHLVGTFEFSDQASESRPHLLWRTVNDVLRSERRRREFLGDALAGNPGWTILLHLYLAEAEGRSIDIDNLCQMAGFTRALVERWLRVLETEALIEPIAFRSDGRQLTPAGIERLEHVIGDFRN